MKKIILVIICALLAVYFVSCSGPNDNKTSVESHQRKIVDLGGNIVNIPPADEIQRIVVMTPPLTSILLGVLADKNMIKGVNKNTLDRANKEILDTMFPQWKNIETSFMSDGFVANTEEILKLRPDIVFYHGHMQKPGIENLGIPIVDTMITGENNPEKMSIAWDNLVRKIFEAKESDTLAREWKLSNETAQKALSSYSGNKKSALYLLSNMSGIITVFGGSTYADIWFEKSNLLNAAAEVKGQSEVSMEQIHEWNPDFIYVFKGTPALGMLTNQASGQDWSLLRAYENKAIFDIPQAVFSWGAPCSDSPLMPLWLISKSYPEQLNTDAFYKLFAGYYKRVYGIDIDLTLIKSVLSEHRED